MNAHTTLPVPRAEISKICKYRTLALEKRAEANVALEAAWEIVSEAERFARQADMGETGGFGRDEIAAYSSLFRPRSWDVDKGMDQYRKHLDRGIWSFLLDRSGMRQMMDAQAHKEFRNALAEDPPEATEDNVRATLEGLFRDADLIFQRGLANAFSGLDRRFKSHDGFKIGSRIIFDRAFNDYSGSSNWDSGTWKVIADVERVLAVLDGETPSGEEALRGAADLDRKGHYGPQQSETETRYFKLRAFKNGNAHLWFTRDDLVERANQLLAEYYGEVIPDAYAEGDGSDLFKSTAVAKDLQFYPSPPHVVDEVIKDLGLSGAMVLEPSAGQGSIAFAAAQKGAQVHAIEVNPLHVDAMRGQVKRRGLGDRVSIQEANFLSLEPRPIYDFVLMNPPFYGTHYMDHVRKAFDWLAPGGILRAVLPASASVNETRKHEAFRKWAKPLNDWGWMGPFKDLPEASFAESGTRINTVLLLIRKRD